MCMVDSKNKKYVIELLLYRPRVYSALDRLMVNMCSVANSYGLQIVCVYSGDVVEQPTIRTDIESAGGILELVSESEKKMIVDIFRLYSKYHPYAVHLHFRMHLWFYTGLLSKIFQSKHFTHVHSLLGDEKQLYIKNTRLYKRIIIGLYLWLVGKMSIKVLATSKAVGQTWKDRAYGTCSNLHHIYTGVPLHTPKYTKHEARKLLNLPNDAIILANVSAIDPVKGLDTAIKAMQILKQKGRNFLFVHVGGIRSEDLKSKEYANYLKSLVVEYKVYDNVIWLGRKNNIQDIISFADIYIHPSRSEGLGASIMEASTASIPLIGSNVGGIPEVIQDKYNGVIVPAEDPDALANSIIDVFDHHIDTYGSNAKKNVYEKFDQDKQAHEFIKLYL